jgi:hypothetical protein
MSKYASSTEVSSEKSRAEIERTLKRYGADGFGYMTQGRMAAIQFNMNGRRVLLRLEMPDHNARQFTHSSRGLRTKSVASNAWEQACRQKWRALALVVKAKLEAVESGITTLEAEFLANTVLPSGQTVGDWALPQVAHVYATGELPKMLPGS